MVTSLFKRRINILPNQKSIRFSRVTRNWLHQDRDLLKATVALYNTDRLHMSIGNNTPEQMHESINPLKTEKLFKNY